MKAKVWFISTMTRDQKNKGDKVTAMSPKKSSCSVIENHLKMDTIQNNES